jgi:CDP-diacylglycerol--glycerol-3-phosphate 3-phosphatidyltransferase
MLNKLRPALARVLGPAGEALARTPLTPNAITIIGTVGVVASALIFYPLGHLFLGALICTIFVLFDMLDGALARVKGTSGPFGAFLDSTLDRVADAAIFGGMIFYFFFHGHGTNDHVLAAVSLFCLVAGALVSYAKARAQSLGLNADVGIAERPERTIIGLTAIGLSGVGLWLLAVLSAVTFGQRVAEVRRSAAAATAAADPAAARGSGSGSGSGGEGAGPA